MDPKDEPRPRNKPESGKFAPHSARDYQLLNPDQLNQLQREEHLPAAQLACKEEDTYQIKKEQDEIALLL